jgi:adenosylcobinamide-GDP ribazoletransferase
VPVGRFAAGPAPDAVVLAYLPFVGIVVGGLAGGLALWASTGFGHVVAVALAFGLSIVLTGAIHVDGFMDSCDALFASVPLERRFEILKDPRHGTFAIAFFAAAAALWIAALWSLPAPLLPQSVAFAAGGARAAAVVNAYVVPYARAGAVTAAFTARPPIGVLFVAFAVLVVLAFTIAPWAWTLLVAALAGSLAAGQRLKRRLGGGLTGDVYGYLVVCCEIALVLGIVAILRFT